MRSIRLSLVVYFLVLQAAALGAAAWLVYYTAGESLRTEQEIHHKLLVKQYEDNVEKERVRFDEDLMHKARALADIVQFPYFGHRTEVAPTLGLGVLTVGMLPQGHLLAPTLVACGSRTPVQAQAWQLLANEMSVHEDLLPRDHDSATELYFQINGERGGTWHSRNLDEDKLYPVDTELSKPGTTIAHCDVTLPTGFPGRSVQLKTPVHMRVRGPRVPSAGEHESATNDPSNQPRSGGVPTPPMPWIIVHCISETRRRDVALSNLNAALASDHHKLFLANSEAQEKLLLRLGAIGLLTFTATVVGGSLFVGYGLAPLRRLTDAVSRVTPRDFQLPLDEKRLPRELDPIATRLRATLDELKRAFEREKQAVADMSHELRTPVAALLATLDVALRKPRSAEEYKNTLVEARGIGKQMRELVERLLALARLDAGVTKLQSGTVDVADLVDQCVTLVRPLATAQELTLSANCPAHLPWFTDGDKVREVLINLLNNAVQYNMPGGSVTVNVSRVDDRLELTVTDTGIGIAEEAIPHLFERFYRVDLARESSELNAGLGLSIVRGYVDLLDGKIEVTSTLGKGTTFRVTLPELSSDRSREAA